MTSLFYNVIGLAVQSGSKSPAPPQPRPGYVVNAPQLPIDDNIWVLIAMGVLLGIFVAYKKYQTTNKAS